MLYNFKLLENWADSIFGHEISKLRYGEIRTKGLLKNKLAILSVEAPVWQGAKMQEYRMLWAFATQSGGMHRRLKWSSYFCASPKLKNHKKVLYIMDPLSAIIRKWEATQLICLSKNRKMN